jgi:hypothetical protein
VTRDVIWLTLGLTIVGIVHADSLNCRLVGTCDLPGFEIDVEVQDSFAYLADFDYGLRIVNVADPQNPSEVGFWGATMITMGVAVRDTLVYAACGSTGLYVISAADKEDPQQVGHCGTPSVAAEVALADTLLYVADRDAGLRIINVADPASPTEIGHVESLGVVNDVTVAGGYAYVVSAESSLHVIDVADPAHPSVVGFCGGLPRDAQGVAISGGLAFVACGDLVVIDVSDPLNPHELGRCVTPDYAMDVRVAGDTAYVADGYSGLRILNVSDPANPQEVGFYDTPGFTTGIDIAGDYFYVTDDQFGLNIFQYYAAGVEESPGPLIAGSPPRPTIVRGVLFLPLSLLTPDCSLLSIDGRKVLNLRPGSNDVSRLAPGVYFRLEPKTHTVRKVVLTN